MILSTKPMLETERTLSPMKILFLLLPLLLLTRIQIANAYEPEAYPGWLWSGTTYDFNRFEGYTGQGSISQGVQWFTLPNDMTFATFASYRWRLRSLNREYFDAVGPAIYGEFAKDFWYLGVQYEWQRFPGLNNIELNYPMAYVRWFKLHDWISGGPTHIFGIPVLGTPTYTWGRITHDFNNFEGLGSMGYVAQAIDWFKMPLDIIFRTQVLYNWRYRTQNTPFYNVHGPSVGVEFYRDTINGGVMYTWDHYPELYRRVYALRAYLNIYTDWDLKKLF